MDKEYVDKRFDEALAAIQEMITIMDSRLMKLETGLQGRMTDFQENMENMRQALRDEIHTSENALRREIQHGQGKAMEEMREQRDILLRLEHFLMDKQEVQGDLIQETRQRVERIEAKVGLPHSLSVAL
ncbi:hypothetical protein [Methylomagnum ishizawai]|uniref:hypothetical protein n=1 Tax=Methylomagnum ishizawai TaxID=1760988 RepID=UPI001C3252AD|nr:hypothetical protein [Methylomagnum ishizawai]BBL77477.1 hypothetical protein MishRS11D_45750 [Methylomagnum ishizawai]